MGNSAIEGVAASGGAGAVSSVNTRTGAVVITAADVGAGQLPAGVLLDSGIIIPAGANVAGILGATSATAAAGDDSRLSDARTPTAHKTSHEPGGSDALTLLDNTSIKAAAGISYTKLALTGSIVGSDLDSAIVLPSGATASTPPVDTNSGALATAAYAYAQAQRDVQFFMNGANVNVFETYDRRLGFSNLAPVGWTTGKMLSVAIFLRKGAVITSLTWRSGGTGESGGSHLWAALYDTQATPALIAQSTDDTAATSFGAAAYKTFTLASPAPYTVPTTGIYYVSISVTGTMPTLLEGGIVSASAGVNTPPISGQKSVSIVSGSALGGTAPSTITSGTNGGDCAYVVTS